MKEQLELSPLAEVVETVDATPYLALLEERFAISPRVFDGTLFFRPNVKWLSMASAELRVPTRPLPHSFGMPFFYVNMRNPRLTTGAALKLGPHARRNLLDLDAAGAESYLRRHQLRVDPAAVVGGSGPGYVLVRYQGRVLGLGTLRQGGGQATLRGIVPRAWSEWIYGR